MERKGSENELNDRELQKLNVISKEELQVEASLLNQHVMVSVVPRNMISETSRTPSTVVCVIDVSGSMQLEASIQSGEGGNESYGFDTLDLVKHSLRTIIKSMTKDDNLALVSFSNKATVVLDLTPMNEAGQKKACNALDGLEPDGATNLWDGLYRGMELLRLRKGKDLHKNAAVLILTDGQPNEEPPRGYIPELQKYKEDCGGEFPGIINTF